MSSKFVPDVIVCIQLLTVYLRNAFHSSMTIGTRALMGEMLHLYSTPSSPFVSVLNVPTILHQLHITHNALQLHPTGIPSYLIRVKRWVSVIPANVQKPLLLLRLQHS